eukprot:551282-Pelagomonas_calceolata.AAC.2
MACTPKAIRCPAVESTQEFFWTCTLMQYASRAENSSPSVFKYRFPCLYAQLRAPQKPGRD